MVFLFFCVSSICLIGFGLKLGYSYGHFGLEASQFGEFDLLNKHASMLKITEPQNCKPQTTDFFSEPSTALGTTDKFLVVHFNHWSKRINKQQFLQFYF